MAILRQQRSGQRGPIVSDLLSHPDGVVHESPQFAIRGSCNATFAFEVYGESGYARRGSRHATAPPRLLLRLSKEAERDGAYRVAKRLRAAVSERALIIWASNPARRRSLLRGEMACFPKRRST
jgi:hypothetical protein